MVARSILRMLQGATKTARSTALFTKVILLHVARITLMQIKELHQQREPEEEPCTSPCRWKSCQNKSTTRRLHCNIQLQELH